MTSGGADPSSDLARVSDGLVEVERETERREAGVVATYRVTTENERPVAVRIVNDLPVQSTDGTGFHPSREPRWWTIEDGRLRFKDTVASAGAATFEFGLAVEGGFEEAPSLPAPEIEHAEPVGVTREGDRMVFPEADAEVEASETETAPPDGDERDGLLSGVRSAVFGGDEEEVVRASDLDPDAMVVTREETAADEPTPSHADNPTLTPVIVAVTDGQTTEAFSELPASSGDEMPDTEGSTVDEGPTADEGSTADDDAGSASEDDVLVSLLAELEDESARTRLRERLGVAELERTREEVRELRAEVSSLRDEVATNADANETTAARVSELTRAVDDLASGLDGAAVAPSGGTESEAGPDVDV